MLASSHFSLYSCSVIFLSLSISLSLPSSVSFFSPPFLSFHLSLSPFLHGSISVTLSPNFILFSPVLLFILLPVLRYHLHYPSYHSSSLPPSLWYQFPLSIYIPPPSYSVSISIYLSPPPPALIILLPPSNLSSHLILPSSLYHPTLIQYLSISLPLTLLSFITTYIPSLSLSFSPSLPNYFTTPPFSIPFHCTV